MMTRSVSLSRGRTFEARWEVSTRCPDRLRIRMGARVEATACVSTARDVTLPPGDSAIAVQGGALCIVRLC